MLAHHKSLMFPIICFLILTSLFENSKQFSETEEQINLQKKTNFYNKVLKSQLGNQNVEIITKKAELYLSAKEDIPELTDFITLNHKYHFTGCKNKIIFQFIIK